MEKNKNVPKLRFPEFTGEWEEKKLGEITSKISDGLHSTPQYTEDSDYYFINGNNLINGKVIINENTKKVELEEYLKHKKELNNTSILISINGTIGSLALYENEQVILGKSACYINVIESIDRLFIYSTLQTSNVINYFTSELSGTTIKNLSLTSIKNTVIKLPSLAEQTKIATFLTAVDEKLTQLKKKKALLEQYKKGVMQKLFSQELRFKDDNNQDFPDWQELPLDKTADIVGGGTPDTSNELLWNGNIQWFTPTELKFKYVKFSNRNITDEGLKQSSAKLLPAGTVLFSSRATIGDASITLKECATNQGFQSFVVGDNLYNEYLYYWIINNKNVFLMKASGSTFLEISKNEVAKINIELPSLPEQQKIANFLSAIDEKISHCGKQIEKMEAWKKGLLQQIFC